MATRINVPPLTRGLMLGLFVLTLLNAGARYQHYTKDRSSPLVSRIYYAPYLTIVPGSSLFYPWVFVSATLAEQNPVGLIITGVTLFYGGRYLERAWSSREYAKFILIIALVPNVLSFFCYLFVFAVTRNIDLLTTAISGGIAIQAAFLVSLKQLVPEHTVTLLRGLVRTRVKHFPAIFLLANTISGIAFGTDTAMLLSWLGFVTSWIYLRFYRISPSLISSATSTATTSGAISGPTIRGDASDTFAFACFFPDVVQPAISAITNPIYEILVSLKICTPFSAADVDASNEQASARTDGDLPTLLHPGKGSGRREEAERRRALALRALDQRLHSNTSKGGAPARPAPAPQPASLDGQDQRRQASPAPAMSDLNTSSEALPSSEHQLGAAPAASNGEPVNASNGAEQLDTS